MYSTNLTVDNKELCLSLHYNGDSSYLFVNDKESINFRAKDSELLHIHYAYGVFQKILL